MRIVVTGGSGRAGRYVIPELVEHGHRVVNVDVQFHDYPGVEYVNASITDYGRTVAVLRGADAVVHLAAIPSPLRFTPEEVFTTNVVSTWNVLSACDLLGIRKVVLASSVNAVGATWTGRPVPPLYFPVDEEHPTRAEDCYSLSKWVGEQVADGFARRNLDMQIASFRFHALLDDDRIGWLRQNPITDPHRGAEGFWGYVHLKDASRAVLMALEAQWKGHLAFFINALDTVLTIPTEEALAQVYPGVPLRRPLPGYASPLSVERAKQVFGWEPLISWRAEGVL